MRLAVVGLGRIGRLHAENLAGNVAGAELAAVVDVDELVARELSARHGVAYTTSFDELLGDPALDGVVIAAPSGLHPTLVKRAAVAGKHVFCEKPLGLDQDACAEAAAAAHGSGVALQVGFQRRFDPGWRTLKQRLDDGAIGSLALFRCSHRNSEPPQEGASLGNVFLDVAIHDLDAARWLGGEVVDLHAAALADGVGATISLTFASGALGLIDVHRHAQYGFECSAELVGSAATLRCGYSARFDETEFLARGRVSAPLARDHAERHGAAYVAELEHFAEVVSGATAPLVGGPDAVAALRLALEAGRAL